jgi:hypothetical protein
VIAWLDEAFGELKEIERGLPAPLSLENGGTSGLEGAWKNSEGFAIQRANVITSLMGAQFQLVSRYCWCAGVDPPLYRPSGADPAL